VIAAAAERPALAHLARAVGYAWAGPWTLLVLLLLVAPLALFRARVRFVRGVVEVTDGPLGPLLSSVVPGLEVAAITLGHVVLARTEATVEAWREHERVHVRQWARWGLLFPFAYLGASLAARLRGRDAYHDNACEREAFAKSGSRSS